MRLARHIINGALILLAVLAMGYALWGQSATSGTTTSGNITSTPTVREYKTTEIQQLKLKVAQQEAQLLQAQLQQVQRQFQEKVTELMSTANKVKLENGWPPETQFSPDTLVFSAPPVKEEKK